MCGLAGRKACTQGLDQEQIFQDLVDVRTVTSEGCDTFKGEYYWATSDACFNLLTQGPCKAGEWFILSIEGKTLLYQSVKLIYSY